MTIGLLTQLAKVAEALLLIPTQDGAEQVGYGLQTVKQALDNLNSLQTRLDYDGSALVITHDSQMISLGDELFLPKLPANFPLNLTGIWETDKELLIPVNDPTLRGLLSNGTDGLVDSTVVKYRSRDAYVAMNFMGVGALDFLPKDYSGMTDALWAIDLAIAEAKAKRIPFNVDGYLPVSAAVVIEDTNGFVMRGIGIIRTTSDSAQYVLDIRNSTAVTAEGNITIDGNSKTNIAAAIRVASIGLGAGGIPRTCSLHHLKLDAINAGAGWQIGDFASPDHLISEMKLSGTTYNTPVGLINIGSQAVINILGMDLVCAGQGVFASYSHAMVINHGGSVTASGSELQMPAVTNGTALISCPIDSPLFVNSYGSFVVMGCPVETPSILFLAYNPGSVPSPEPDTGGVIMEGNRGYHNCSAESFQGVASFTGNVFIGTNGFHRTVAKTSQNGSFLGLAKFKISDEWADDHFIKGLAGMGGGIALFDHRKIFEANNLVGKSLTGAGAVTSLNFQSYASTGDNGHFYSNYNYTTGEFTIPAGGLKSVRVSVGLVVGSPNVNSSIIGKVDGTIISFIGANSSTTGGTMDFGDLVAGQKILIEFQNGGSTFAASGIALDRMSISARR